MSQPTKGCATILRQMAEDYPFHRNRPKPSKAALVAGAEALESLALPGATAPPSQFGHSVSRPHGSAGAGPDRGTDRYRCWLPVTPELGHLVVAKVYVEHDGPRLFLCANRADQLFLFLSVEDGPEWARWMVIPISRQRLFLLTSNHMDLHQAFSQPEERPFRLDFAYGGSTWRISPWPVEELTDAVLPDRGAFLNPEPPRAFAESAIAPARACCWGTDETSKRLADVGAAFQNVARILVASFDAAGRVFSKFALPRITRRGGNR